jgi:hypothetical protein
VGPHRQKGEWVDGALPMTAARAGARTEGWRQGHRRVEQAGETGTEQSALF